MTSPEIALVTSSGKAYYQLTSALKRKRLQFHSLTPEDTIPRHVKAVITTEHESQFVTHPTVFIFSDEDPATFINRVTQHIHGKKEYAQVAIGIDPGQHCGLALLGDGIVLETRVFSNMTDVVPTLQSLLNNISTQHTTIRIGNGNPSVSTDLRQLIQDKLDPAIEIEIVDEHGTTKKIRHVSSYNRVSKDIYSAILIARRHGERIARD